MRIINTEYLEYKQGHKDMKIPYNKIKAIETTLEGKLGKYTPFGFILKPEKTNKQKAKDIPQPKEDKQDKPDKPEKKNKIFSKKEDEKIEYEKIESESKKENEKELL